MAGQLFKDIQAFNVSGISFDDEKLSVKRVRQSVLGLLKDNVLCSMATVTPAGQPHINTAYFSYSDALEIYFLSHPDSLHCQNLLRNSSMAMTVFSTAQRWTNPGQGVQLFGTGQKALGSSAQEAERSYGKRFRAYERWRANLRNDDPARQYRFYRFKVAAIKILDERNFGDGVFICAAIIR